MIQNTSNKPLSELFSADNSVTYHIPKYQREYIWSKWNWEALFDDIEESDGGHFMGSIICINIQKDSHKAAELELVDGQQRMTTISLFYLAIYKYLKENLSDKTDLNAQLELLALRNRIFLKDNANIRLFPSYTNSNLDDYRYIFSLEIEDIKTSKKPKFLGNRQIARAFNYFHLRFQELDDNGIPLYNVGRVTEILKKLNSATIVKIDVATHADAFTLFETLNNRGVPLSAIDLIKNKLLGHLEKLNSNTTINENFERWNQIIENLSDEYSIQERFLRQFYNAFKQEEFVEVEKATKALRSNLIRIYEVLINRNADEIFSRLEDASIIYSRNIQYEIGEHSSEMIRALRNLENVNGADGYMLLLFLEKRFELTEMQKISVINLLCNYFIRRNVTDSPPTRDLTNIFMEVIAEINQFEQFDFVKIRTVLLEKGRPATDSYFREKLQGNLYDENVGATRYILSSIELAQTQTKERYINFYERNKNLFLWTVEHILPQGDKIPSEWVSMIANDDVVLANQILKRCVHKLGNLTLTAYNSNLSNMSLVKKQERKNAEGKYIGFKNGLMLNEVVKDSPTWTENDIEDRTKDLVEKALKIFELL